MVLVFHPNPQYRTDRARMTITIGEQKVGQRRAELNKEDARLQDEFRSQSDSDDMVEWLKTTLKRKHVGEGRLLPSVEWDRGAGVAGITSHEFEAGLHDVGINLDPAACRTLFRCVSTI